MSTAELLAGPPLALLALLADSVALPNDARLTEGWVSSPGKAKRGAGTANSLRAAHWRVEPMRCIRMPRVPSYLAAKSAVCGFDTGRTRELRGCSPKRTTTAAPSREI